MNFNDKEINVIKRIQMLSTKEITFINVSSELKNFFDSIYYQDMFVNWTDSSSKDKLPPDFYSDKYGYMLEVMRFDDYENSKNNPNALESILHKELNNERRKNSVPTFEDLNVELMIIPDYSKASINSYDLYLSNFKRVFMKHANKINMYKENHPGYKIGFLLVDESAGYAELYQRKKNKTIKPGEIATCSKLHMPFLDERFMEVIKDTDIDYIIWYIPYKNNGKNIILFPSCALIDVNLLNKKQYFKHEYDPERMQCLEV